MYLNEYEMEALVSQRLDERRAMAARARLIGSHLPAPSVLRLLLPWIRGRGRSPGLPAAAASPEGHGAGARA